MDERPENNASAAYCTALFIQLSRMTIKTLENTVHYTLETLYIINTRKYSLR